MLQLKNSIRKKYDFFSLNPKDKLKKIELAILLFMIFVTIFFKKNTLLHAVLKT